MSRRFKDAWVLMDRIHDSDDSAEHLFQYLREKRTDVNSFFVVEQGTPDWTRLRKHHKKRVVAHGSTEWKLLMLNAAHLISSHADAAICFPSELRDFTPHPWRFTFLQHGVIKDDLSGWLNGRPIEVFVTSTRGEHESVVADRTPYRFTDKQVRLTGLPRFDLLHQQAARYPTERRDLILVSPTWRVWLVPKLERGSQRRGTYDRIADTDYMRTWLDFLRSAELEAAAKAHGVQVASAPAPEHGGGTLPGRAARAHSAVELPEHP